MSFYGLRTLVINARNLNAINIYNKFINISVDVDLQEGRQDASGASGAAGGSRGGRARESGSGSGHGGDDREGFIMHPKKGRVPTYIFQVSKPVLKGIRHRLRN